ncbi:hypothetical protein BRADI_3g16215v3 [Brachypodium distachyon]|uniref:E3 ubiquitin-protein ligase RMA n=1 Tax=Brachypodium distachyon TaxID=15368 RepID=A0A0Q3JAJ4_BRADI|nr:hypothetical protein BRADI_3g16215v3 [Brachypodium distachyon]
MAGEEPAKGSQSSRRMDLNLNPLPWSPGRLGGAMDCPEPTQLSEMPIAELLRMDEPPGLLVLEEPPLQPFPELSLRRQVSDALSMPDVSNPLLTDPMILEWLDGLIIGNGEGLDDGEPVVVQSNDANASSALPPPLLPTLAGLEEVGLERMEMASATQGRGSVSIVDLTPEFRLQLAIQVGEHDRIVRPRRVSHYEQASSPEADRLVQAITRSHSSLGVSRGAIKNWNCGCNSSFECNICLEADKEPVVTPCGHFFCWPCLYQWLNGHSIHSECPVCNREVFEVNVTPIYGRSVHECDPSNNDVPPRPHANTMESLRQQLQTQDPRGIASADPVPLHAGYTASQTLLEPEPI